MKPLYLLYGIVLGLLPLVAEPVDPHGWPSVLPIGVIGGLILTIFG